MDHRPHPVMGLKGGNLGNCSNTSGQHPILDGAMKNSVFLPKYPATIFRLSNAKCTALIVISSSIKMTHIPIHVSSFNNIF